MGHGLKIYNLDVVTLTSGTASQASSTALPSYSAIITAEASNTGNVYIGDASVSITKGIPIEPGNTLTIAVNEPNRYSEVDISDIYIITSTTGNKVRVSCLRRKA
jgi:hypothetical protein